MNHFFVQPENIRDNHVYFPPDISHQIVRVLRLRPNSRVVVLDNSGIQFEVSLNQLDSQQCIGEIIWVKKNNSESKTRLHLLVALTQREKFELILQKSCELGVNQITPLLTDRSIQMTNVEFEKKKDRWNRILKESAEQSRRGLVPTLNTPISMQDAYSTDAQLKLIAWENDEGKKLKEFLKKESFHIALMTGPEGGFSEEEVFQAQTKGWETFSLGRRILRMETAVIVACALVFHLVGEF